MTTTTSIVSTVEMIELSVATLIKKSNSIIEMRFREDEYEIEVEDIYEIRNAYSQLTGDGIEPCGIVVLTGRFGTITKEAREIEMFEDHVYSNVMGIAIVVNTLFKRIMGNLYFSMKRSRPLFEHRLFSSEKSGQKWVLTQIPKF